jgi:methyl-accepting chemotaxis protein
MKLALTPRLVLAIVITGLIPAVVIGFLAIKTARQMAAGVGENCELIAATIADKIDRNLFERYGDIQAFGVNDAVHERSSWYQPGSEKNRIANAANQYARLYGFYLLSYFVDVEGKVVAVNDRDPAGQPLNTTWLYQKNFKDAAWFKACLAGQFTKSDTLDGTYLEDLHVDEDVKRAYQSDGLVLGFSAPVKDAAGKVIGVWRNCANFSFVEEIVTAPYQHFKQNGCPAAEITIVDRQGRVIVDFDPSLTGKEAVSHDLNVIQKLNLAEKGLKSVQDLVAGKKGHGIYVHARKKVGQVNGYAPCEGALGFPSFKWGVLVRVPESEALVVMHSQMRNISIVIGVSILGLIVAGLWLGRSISRPLLRGINVIQEVGTQITVAAGQVSMASQSTAAGASEQAASLEETSSSLEEMASLTKRNADSARQANELSRQTRVAADAGAQDMLAMDRAMQEIKTASSDINKIIKTIDEIAFQTNLLALNAAVEAARAGEAGQGFAVVADEVRSLAQRSAQAAKDTATKIEDAINRSENGVQINNKVAAALRQIITQVQQVDTAVEQIAAACNEQSGGIAEINSAITQLDQVTQRNSASAEESASAAEELDAQGKQLQESVAALVQLVGPQNRSRSEVAIAPISPGDTLPGAKAFAAVGRSGPAASDFWATSPTKKPERILKPTAASADFKAENGADF